MFSAAELLERVYLEDIPNLDPPLFYKRTEAENGFERIILPSGHTAYHIKRYSDVQSVLLDRRFIRAPSNEEGGASVFPTLTPKELLLNNDHPVHARLKTLVSRDFSPTGVASLRPLALKIIDERLDAMRDGGSQGDLYLDLLDHVPSRVICEFMGLNPADMDYYRPLSYTVQIASRDDIPELVRQFTLVYQYLLDLVRKDRWSSPDGYLSRILAMRDDPDPPFTDEELVGVLIGVLLGGDQNLLTVMTKVVYTLLAAPALYDRLVEEPELIPVACEELFRMIPLGVVSAFPRIASEDLDLPWGQFPAGAALYPDVFAANRDPDVFEAPYEFRLDRKGPRHLQFGYGMHACMGAALARMEISTVIEALVKRVPTLRLAVPAQDIPWQDGLILRRPTALPVAWQAIL